MTQALQPGTRIHGQIVEQWLCAMPDGHRYRVCDAASGRHATLHEFLPPAWAHRDGDGVIPLPGRARDFGNGLQHFVQRARQLTEFEHSALPQLLELWSSNGTAYVLMPDSLGQTVAERVAEHGGRLPPAMVWPWLRTCFEVAGQLHAQGRIHGAWDPGAVWVRADGTLLLPAPQVDGGLQPPSPYIALEQTLLASGTPCGPWTDVFGIAALAGFMLTGENPMALQRRPMFSFGAAGAGRAAESVLAAIRVSLMPNPRQRPQEIAQLEAMIGTALLPSATLAGLLPGAAGAGPSGPGIDALLGRRPGGGTPFAPTAAARTASAPASAELLPLLPPAVHEAARTTPSPALAPIAEPAATTKSARPSLPLPEGILDPVGATPGKVSPGKRSRGRLSSGKPAGRAEGGRSRRRNPAAPPVQVVTDSPAPAQAADVVVEPVPAAAEHLVLPATAAAPPLGRTSDVPILMPGAMPASDTPIDAAQPAAMPAPRRAAWQTSLFAVALALVMASALFAAWYLVPAAAPDDLASRAPAAEPTTEAARLLDEAPPAAGGGQAGRDATAVEEGPSRGGAAVAAATAPATGAASADSEATGQVARVPSARQREAGSEAKVAVESPTPPAKGAPRLTRCSQALLEQSLGAGSAGASVSRECR